MSSSIASATTVDTCKAIIHTDAPLGFDATGHATPDDTVSDKTQIGGSNGYTTGGTDIALTGLYARNSTGTVTFAASDVTWTASGGNLGASTTGRYFSIYDDTATTPLADPLICCFDYSATFTVLTGETMTLDFGTTLFTLA